MRFLLNEIQDIVFGDDPGYGTSQHDALSMVISTHFSKSVELPVVQMTRPDLGLVLTMRNNFYNWKLSVSTPKPFKADFTGLFYEYPPRDPGWSGDHLSSCYFEGFPEDLVYGYRGKGRTEKWSAEIHTNVNFQFVIQTILRGVNPPKPLRQGTRKEAYADRVVTIAAEKRLSAAQLSGLMRKYDATFVMSDRPPQYYAGHSDYVPVEGCRAEKQGTAVVSINAPSIPDLEARMILKKSMKGIAEALEKAPIAPRPRKKAKACPECDGDRVVAEGEGAQTYLTNCKQCSVLVET